MGHELRSGWIRLRVSLAPNEKTRSAKSLRVPGDPLVNLMGCVLLGFHFVALPLFPFLPGVGLGIADDFFLGRIPFQFAA
jgi:hypothetical protein